MVVQLGYIVIALTFAANRSNLWLRLLGYGLAAAAAGELVRHGWRRLRQRNDRAGPP